MTPEELYADLQLSFKNVGIRKDDNCYIAGNISALARTRIKKDILLSVFLSSFREAVGSMGTLFSPSASMNLCNTKTPFDIENTPSHEMGALAEFIRAANGSVRSFHPFWSISGLGDKASILNKVSRHSYGTGSPWSKFLDLDTRQVNIGLHPSKAVTLIHHIEVITGVPYRYTKEFLHPILNNGEISVQPFYMSVLYKDADIKKRINLNEHYFNELQKRSLLLHTRNNSGLDIWSFKMRDFYDVATEFFVKDIYNYLEHPPKIKPYSI